MLYSLLGILLPRQAEEVLCLSLPDDDARFSGMKGFLSPLGNTGY